MMLLVLWLGMLCEVRIGRIGLLLGSWESSGILWCALVETCLFELVVWLLATVGMVADTLAFEFSWLYYLDPGRSMKVFFMGMEDMSSRILCGGARCTKGCMLLSVYVIRH